MPKNFMTFNSNECCSAGNANNGGQLLPRGLSIHFLHFAFILKVASLRISANSPLPRRISRRRPISRFSIAATGDIGFRAVPCMSTCEFIHPSCPCQRAWRPTTRSIWSALVYVKLLPPPGGAKGTSGVTSCDLEHLGVFAFISRLQRTFNVTGSGGSSTLMFPRRRRTSRLMLRSPWRIHQR